VSYWDVTKSGKVLELRVRPSIDREPGKYRIGIIQIGRIISRLQKLAKHAGSKPQIQLFPNLAENQLAATVYWPDFLEDMPYEKTQNKNLPLLSDRKIEKIAEHYDFALISNNSGASEDEVQVRITYFVLSKSNQPFIWLKLGQFIHDVTDHTKTSDAHEKCSIEVLTAFTPETHSPKRMVSYKQAKVTLNSSARLND
jgi:hypothetical protein